MAAEEILDIVNDHDEVIGQCMRAEIYGHKLLYRVIDFKGKFLLQKSK